MVVGMRLQIPHYLFNIWRLLMKRKNLCDVYAPDDGQVIIAFRSPDYGLCIYIKYEDGSASLQAHHEENYVKDGDYVKQGQVIAKMGDTGNGPKHGHLGYFPPGFKELKGKYAINPVPWLIRINFYPYNTKVSGSFHERYYTNSRGYYLHEGLDFSGKYPVKSWRRGIDARKQYYYKA